MAYPVMRQAQEKTSQLADNYFPVCLLTIWQKALVRMFW